MKFTASVALINDPFKCLATVRWQERHLPAETQSWSS